MSRNITYAHFDVDVLEHRKLIALVEEGGADAYVAWQALICWARRALDPERMDLAGVINVAIARRVIGALGLDPKTMVELLEKHRLLDPMLEPGTWYIHEFYEHQHLDAWLARMDRNRKGGLARGAQLRAQAQAKGQPTLEPRLSTNPTQPNPTQQPPKGGCKNIRAFADANFDRFWAVYPRRISKTAARKAWDKAVQKTSPDKLIDAAVAYAEWPGRDQKFTKHPATWLNQGCWDDELPEPAPAVTERGTWQ